MTQQSFGFFDLALADGCAPCAAYIARRKRAVFPAVNQAADARGVNRLRLLDAFLDGVHDRHTAGLSLDTDGALS